jgi:hypothetical protein
MKLLVAVCLLTIYVITVDARSVLQNSVDLLVSSSSHEDESNVRHHLEHSTVMQELHWSLRKLGKNELCEFCDLVVPVVS